jgi:hypothetical protein
MFVAGNINEEAFLHALCSMSPSQFDYLVYLTDIDQELCSRHLPQKIRAKILVTHYLTSFETLDPLYKLIYRITPLQVVEE